MQTLSLASGFGCVHETSKELSKFLIHLEKKGFTYYTNFRTVAKKINICYKREAAPPNKPATYIYIYLPDDGDIRADNRDLKFL